MSIVDFRSVQFCSQSFIGISLSVSVIELIGKSSFTWPNKNLTARYLVNYCFLTSFCHFFVQLKRRHDRKQLADIRQRHFSNILQRGRGFYPRPQWRCGGTQVLTLLQQSMADQKWQIPLSSQLQQKRQNHLRKRGQFHRLQNLQELKS